MPRKPIQKVKLTKKVNKKVDEPIIDIDLTEDHVDRKTIEKIAGFKVNNLGLYQRALVHDSIETLVNKSKSKNIRPYLMKSYQTLEFLGDNILKGIMAEYLIRRFPNKNEGFMSKVKTRMERTSMLCHFSEQIGIDGNILMSGQAISVGCSTKGNPANDGILEDAFEAFVGAIYLDFGETGFEMAKKFALNVFDKYMDDEIILKDTNYKDKLIRYCNNVKVKAPEYRVRETYGEAHDRTFVVDVYMFVNSSNGKGELSGTGTEKTKKAAEQAASKKALIKYHLLK